MKKLRQDELEEIIRDEPYALKQCGFYQKVLIGDQTSGEKYSPICTNPDNSCKGRRYSFCVNGGYKL